MNKSANLGDLTFTTKEMQDALKANADGGAQSYVGLNDDSLDFGNAESFIDESEGGKEFNIKIINTYSEAKKIQFNQIISEQLGYNILAEGDINIDATDNTKKITVVGEPRSFNVLRDLIKNAPTRLRAIRFNVNNEGQLDEVVKYIQETPYEEPKIVQKKPSNFQDQDTNNTKTVTIDLRDWILSYESTILYTIRANETVNLTLYFGGSYDTAKALSKKHKRAITTAAQVFARQNA